jgi:hypothetical protein
MTKKDYIVLGSIAVIVIACIGFFAFSGNNHLATDFAGGIQPTNLWSGNAAGGYVAPVGSLAMASPNGLYLGGVSQYNEQSVYETASGTPSAAVTLGALGLASSTATTTVTVPNTAGLAIGAICSGGAATTTVYVSGCLLASTNGATGTATVAYSNMTGANLAVPTSTVIRLTFDELPY